MSTVAYLLSAAVSLLVSSNKTELSKKSSRVLSSVGFLTAAGGVCHSLVCRLWCRWFILNKLLSQKILNKLLSQKHSLPQVVCT
jgi:hypothetical protein